MVGTGEATAELLAADGDRAGDDAREDAVGGSGRSGSASPAAPHPAVATATTTNDTAAAQLRAHALGTIESSHAGTPDDAGAVRQHGTCRRQLLEGPPDHELPGQDGS